MPDCHATCLRRSDGAAHPKPLDPDIAGLDPDPGLPGRNLDDVSGGVITQDYRTLVRQGELARARSLGDLVKLDVIAKDLLGPQASLGPGGTLGRLTLEWRERSTVPSVGFGSPRIPDVRAADFGPGLRPENHRVVDVDGLAKGACRDVDRRP
jgi:hypothetical protein